MDKNLTPEQVREFLDETLPQALFHVIETDIDSETGAHLEDIVILDMLHANKPILKHERLSKIIDHCIPRATDTSKLIEGCTIIAHERMLDDNRDIIHDEDEVFEDPDADMLVYKPEFQEKFNDWYDYYYSKLAPVFNG